MVLPKPDGGFYTTEAPDRTYKTERGAKQAERMFQNPQLYQGWTRQGRQQEQDTILDTVIDEAEDFVNDETGLDLDLNNNEEEDFFEEEYLEEEENEEEDEDPFIGWYELPRAIRDAIHDSASTYHCIEELLSNGWTGVHLSSMVEDFGQSFVDLYL